MAISAVTSRSRFETASTSPKSSSWMPGGESGASASSAPSPNRDVTTTPTEVSRSMPRALPRPAMPAAAAPAPTAPPAISGRPSSDAPTSPGNMPCDRLSAL